MCVRVLMCLFVCVCVRESVCVYVLALCIPPCSLTVIIPPLPFLQVQIAHIAKLIDLPIETVEGTLSQVCQNVPKSCFVLSCWYVLLCSSAGVKHRFQACHELQS